MRHTARARPPALQPNSLLIRISTAGTPTKWLSRLYTIGIKVPQLGYLYVICQFVALGPPCENPQRPYTVIGHGPLR